jgi:plasmid stabilization system protein ParE
MPLDVKFTEKALENLNIISEYLALNFRNIIVEKFKSKTLSSLELLTIFPQIGNVEDKDSSVFGFVSSKYTSIFYRFDNKTLYILNIFDNRQNPNKK